MKRKLLFIIATVFLVAACHNDDYMPGLPAPGNEDNETEMAEQVAGRVALNRGMMVSSAMSNYKLPEAVNTYGLSREELAGLHQQFDFFNTMTYDNGTMDGHSPMWLHNQSKEITITKEDVVTKYDDQDSGIE